MIYCVQDTGLVVTECIAWQKAGVAECTDTDAVIRGDMYDKHLAGRGG